MNNKMLHTQEVNLSTTPVDTVHEKVIIQSSRYKIFDVKFDTWEPNSLHWVSPSNMIIYDDGSWFIYVQHIANFRRTGGIFDTGDYWTWLINVQFINAQESVVHANDYIIRGLGYKGEQDNATSQGIDKQIFDTKAQIAKGSFTRIIR
jgi:hypothetical protein